jgi:hypothetical protein
MAEEKRMIDTYEVKAALRLAGGEVIIAEDSNNKEAPYIVCDCSWDNPFGADEYRNGSASTDYLEIIREFTDRISARLDALEAERKERGLPAVVMTAADCIPGGMDTGMEGKIIIIKASSLSPEYRSAEHQLAICTGGFGAQPNARGQKVYCKELYSGKESYRNRHSIAGVAAEENLPEWAKEKLAEIRTPQEKESVIAKLREAKETKSEREPKPAKRKKQEPEI